MRKYAYIVAAAIALGGIGTLVKLIGDHVHFMTVNFYRIFLGMLSIAIVSPGLA